MEQAMLINGKMVTSDSWVDVINPANEEVVAKVPACTEAQLNEAVIAATAAQKLWGAKTIQERREALQAYAGKLVENAEEIGRLLTLEQGKPIGDAIGEVHGAAAFMMFTSSLDLPKKVLQDDDKAYVVMTHKPLGVVGGIVPWNFPVLMASWKIAAPLLAGNSVVLKPAPTTPLATLKMAELSQGTIPAGVLNVISDSNDIGPKMTAHPGISKIAFTGSTETGKHVMRSAVDTMKRVTLEMGGNDPSIVLPDVDVKETAQKVFHGAFWNSGQICLAVKRAYVHEDIYDEFCNELVNLSKQVVLGDGLQQGTTHGPVQNKAQFEKVKSYIEDAKANGTIIAGGKTGDDKGYFIEPTIVRDVTDGHKVVDEEQFGPILPVIAYKDVEDVITRANASEYGLGGAVHSKNEEKAMEIADRIESGTVWVNQQLEIGPHIPIAGFKSSGLGAEHGVEGLLEYTQIHVMNVAR